MKHLFVIFAVFSLAFFYACQENSITDPVINDTGMQHTPIMQNDLDKDALSYYTGVIKLEGTLLDPSHYFNSYAEINGIVRYRIEDMHFGARPPFAGIKVNLYVNAELKGGCPGYNRPWIVNETAESIVFLSSSTQLLQYIEKSFRVQNTCCGRLNLAMKFQLGEKHLTLESMQLVKVNTTIFPVGDPISQ